jgi:uncharacterized membrane protein
MRSWLSRFSPRSVSLASLLAFVVVIAGTFAWAWGFTSIYRNPNTRVQFTRWAYENIPGPLNLKLETDSGPYINPLSFPQGTPIVAGAPFRFGFRTEVTGTVTAISVGYAANQFDPNVPGVLRVVLSADPDGQQVLAQTDIAIQPTAEVTNPRGASYSAPIDPVLLDSSQVYYLSLSAPQGEPIMLSGSTLAIETWDEPLPMRLGNLDPFGGIYQGLQMEVPWLDNEDKRQMLLQNIEQTDYIILQSQRRLWASSRLPTRYPMTMEYYRALFDGRLGFEKVAEFQSPFVIGPLQVSDAPGTWAWGRTPQLNPNPDDPFNNNLFASEEAFSVYDHAPVWVFRKRPDFNMDRARAILNAVDLTKVVDRGPRDASLAPTLLMLPPERVPQERAGGTWSEMFDAASLINTNEAVAVAVWYLTMVIIGWLAFPLTYAAFGGLPDRGYPLSKTVALLVVAWLVWMAGSLRLLPHTRGTVMLGFAVLALVSGAIAWWKRLQIRDYVRGHWRHLLVVEGVTLALFGFMLFIRWNNPDLWHPYFGGEKPMDFSYFNAVLKSTYFPPYDPWLAGGYLNYYYYGFVVVGLLTKLLGVVPALAYNLFLPMLFALVGINAFSAAYNLVEALREKQEKKGTEGTEGNASRENPNFQIPAKRPNGQTPVSGPGGFSEDGRSVEAISDPQPSREASSLQAQPVESVAEASYVQETATPSTEVDNDTRVFEQETVIASAQTPTPTQTTEYEIPNAAPQPGSNFQPPISNLQSLIPNPYLAGLAAALLIVVLGNLGQLRTYLVGFQGAADRAALVETPLGDLSQNDMAATLNGMWRVARGEGTLSVGLGSWYWDATRIVDYTNPEGGNEITEFPFFTFLYADPHAHLIVMPFNVLSIAWALALVLMAGRRRAWPESAAFWFIGGLTVGVSRPSNTWDYPMYLALGAAAIVAAQVFSGNFRLSRAGLWPIVWRIALLAGLSIAFYRPFDQWVAVPLTELKLWEGSKTSLEGYLYVYGLFFFILLTFLIIETRRWMEETPASVLQRANEWMPTVTAVAIAFLLSFALLMYLDLPITIIALPLLIWAGLLALRSPAALPLERRAVLFMFGTGLAVTLFVDVVVLGGDRMNTIFKLYMQVWMLFSVAAAAALAWAWADRLRWSVNWRSLWVIALAALGASAALYTVTAASAKMRDRFPPRVAVTSVDPGTDQAGVDCKAIPGMPLPAQAALEVEDQPGGLNGLAYMTWSTYCEQGWFLPLTYDYDAIRWMQDNVQGSPVIVEGHTSEYRYGTRYTINTGLPGVVGWNYHQRQQRGAIPTDFVWERVHDIAAFYCSSAQATPETLAAYPYCAEIMSYPDLSAKFAFNFLQKYDVTYVIVGPLEKALYPPEGLAKLDEMAAMGVLRRVYDNPGVIIYEVQQLAGN